jgi:hypothetical protein
MGPSGELEGSSTGSTTSTASSTTVVTITVSTAGPDDTGGTTTTDSTGSAFLSMPDAGPLTTDCDLFAQDCPPGEKCTVWANDGGNTWNATRCVPVVADPVEVDQPCHMERSSASGLDDCDFGVICIDVDAETLEGICVPLCVGDASAPYCEDPNRVCPIVADGGVLFCRPLCNPLQPDCLEGQGCYYDGHHWTCALDASGELGAYGDACVFANVCDPGLVCLNSELVPPGEACEGAAGCCTEVCDLSDPAGAMQCAGAAGGQICQSWYADGAPRGYENVGVCALPQ